MMNETRALNRELHRLLAERDEFRSLCQGAFNMLRAEMKEQPWSLDARIGLFQMLDEALDPEPPGDPFDCMQEDRVIERWRERRFGHAT